MELAGYAGDETGILKQRLGVNSSRNMRGLPSGGLELIRAIGQQQKRRLVCWQPVSSR